MRDLRCRFLRFHELASGMTPTARARDGVASYHPDVTTVSVSQQNLGVVLQKFFRALSTAVQGEVEYVVGVRFVAHIHPHARRLRLARTQHRQDRVVGGHHMRLPDPLGHPLIQRLDHIRDISAPHRLRGPGNLKALPLENIFQPIEWEVIRKFASYDEGQQPRTRKALFDGRLWLGRYFEPWIFSLPLTMGARILLADMLEAFEVSRNVLDLPALLAADLLALLTAAWADPFFRAQLVYVSLHWKILKVGQSTPPLAA